MLKTAAQCILLLCCVYAAESLAYIPNATSFELSHAERMWLDKHPNITVAFDGHFPPYSFVNNNGEVEGISVDVFKILERKLGIGFVQSRDNTWNTLYQAAQNRKIDVVATMVKKPERESSFHFTSPYIMKSLVIITEAENQAITQRDDLNNKTVALVKGYHYIKGILKEYPSIKPYYVDTILEGLRAVSTDKADAAITFLGAAHYIRSQYLLTNLKYAAVYDKKNAFERIAVRSDWPQLQSILDRALTSIPEATMQQLRAKWLPADYDDLIVEIDLSEQEQQWIAEHRDIRLGIDPEFAPFEFLSNKRYSGIASDYIQILNQRLDLNMQVVPDLSWDEVMSKVEIGEIDVLPSIGKNQQRLAYLNFTEPYLNFHRVIITRWNAPFITSLSDLSDLSVGVQIKTSHHGYLLENSTITPRTFTTLQAALLALSGGKIDAMIGNVASSTYWIRKLNLTNLKVSAPVSNEAQNLHFAIRKDWPELVTILQKGLDSISPQKKKNISEKWLYIKVEPTRDYSLVWRTGLGFSIVITAILLWNLLLNKKVRERTSELMRYAYYDQLTGLPNRFLIQDRLSLLITEANRNTHKLAMLSVDLDDFKKINDSYGHASGDKILIEVASSFKSVLPAHHILGRLGGDQFLIILNRLDDTSSAAKTAKNLLKILEKPFAIDDNAITFTASIGIAIYPNDGSSAEELLKNADSATHHSKAQGNGSFEYFTHCLHKTVSRRLKIEEQMRTALQKNEFFVVYQPKFYSASNLPMGCEALLRWHNKDLGDIYPDEFIPIAESNGMIEPLGQFVLQSALQTLAIMHNRHNVIISMAVNFSPRQFQSPHLLDKIQQALDAAGMEPRFLEIEITEGVLMSGSSNIEMSLKALKGMGISLAMDDYGTGYSSLSYLRKFTFDILKIDREFITELESNQSDQQLVAATIAMAHSLNIKVVAEGVETEIQYALLKKYHCDILQGWYISKPLLEDALFAWIEKPHTLRQQQ